MHTGQMNDGGSHPQPPTRPLEKARKQTEDAARVLADVEWKARNLERSIVSQCA